MSRHIIVLMPQAVASSWLRVIDNLDAKVHGMYVCESDYHQTRRAAMQVNYEELRRRYITMQQQCEALLQEINKEGNA